MAFFLVALVLAALGVGAYGYSNTGVHDIVILNYHFIGIPDWLPVAIATGGVLLVFLLQAVYSSVRISMLRRANRRMRSELVSTQLEMAEADVTPPPAGAQRPLQPTSR